MWKIDLKKGDIVVIVLLLLAALSGLVISAWQNKEDTRGLSAEIYQNGALIQTVALYSGEQRIWLENSAGYNLLLAGPQGIMMLEANCNNQDCLRYGCQSRPGGMIVCLPHRLLVRLSGAKDGAFDAVTY